MFSKLSRFALDVLFPKICLGCGIEGAFCCTSCLVTLEEIPPSCFVCERRSPDGWTCDTCRRQTPIRRFMAPLKFNQTLVRNLLHAFKFQGVSEMGETLAEPVVCGLSMYQFLPYPPESIFLVPLPLRPKRLRERGFNQAELLAEAIGRKTGIRLDTKILERTANRPPQTSIKRKEEREKNVEGVFRARAPLDSRTIYILVDDVATTGATLNDAARALRAGGAHKIWAITAAR